MHEDKIEMRRLAYEYAKTWLAAHPELAEDEVAPIISELIKDEIDVPKVEISMIVGHALNDYYDWGGKLLYVEGICPDVEDKITETADDLTGWYWFSEADVEQMVAQFRADLLNRIN